MSERELLSVFEQYQQSRLQFVHSVADLARKPQNTGILINTGVIALLHPLMLDEDTSIQQATTEALSLLANQHQSLAEAVVSEGILPQLVLFLGSNNISITFCGFIHHSQLFLMIMLKRTAALVLCAVAKHSSELSQAVVDSGGIDSLRICLLMRDPSLVEAAAGALGSIVQHNASLSQLVRDAGAVHLLLLCLKEDGVAVKCTVVSALKDICKHTPELAQDMVDLGAMASLAQMTKSPDAELKRQVFLALSHISKHSASLSKKVLKAEVFPAALLSLKDPDEYVRRSVAILLREVTKHSPKLAQMIVNWGGLEAVIDYLGSSHGNLRLPGIKMLGYVAAHSETLAMAVILSKGVPQLALCLSEESEQHMKAATVWSIGKIGSHTPEHAKAVATANLLPRLLELYMDAGSSEDLQARIKKAMEGILQNCTSLLSLMPLLNAPTSILKHVLCQLSKVLHDDSEALHMFVTSGGLKRVLEIDASPHSELLEHIDTITSCFPDEIVKYYRPGYLQALLETLKL